MAKKPLSYGFASADSIAWRALIYGDYASGKTTIAASANLSDSLGPVIVGNIDMGLASVSHWEGLREVALHSPADLEQFLNDLSLPKEQMPAILRPVKTIIIDSVSALREETLVAFTEVQFKKGRREDAFDNQWKDFGRATNFLLSKFDELRAQGYNIILTAGLSPVMQDDTQIGVRPDLNAALLKGLNYRMSNIWYAERSAAKSQYRLLIDDKPKLGIKTKTRNTLYREALKTLTRKEAVTRGADPEKEDGWYYIPHQDHPTLPTLYDLYITSGAAQTKEQTENAE
jgi:hypothetical protein